MAVDDEPGYQFGAVKEAEELYALDWTDVGSVIFGIDSGAAVTIMQ